jgi:lysophospholipase L1-like esterase
MIPGEYPMTRSALIMCFGDSLTAGFQSPTVEHPTGQETPYGQYLQDYLGGSVRVRTSGVCGELTGEMVMRFRRDVLNHKPEYVSILGGTNDLGWDGTPDDIMRNLVKLYEQTFAGGGIPIPVTVPSIRIEGGQHSGEGQAWVAAHLARRGQLNQLIREYATAKHIACVDLFRATADPETNQLAARYSNDGLHLTTAGYRLFAEQVALVLSPLLFQGGQS